MLRQLITEVLRPLRAYKAATMAFCTIAIIVGLIIPYAIGILLDGIEQPLDYIFTVAGLIAVIVVADFLLNWTQNVMWFTLVFRSINLVRKHMYQALVHKDISFHNSTTAGDLSNKLLNDAADYAEIRAILLPMLFLNLLRISVVLIFLLIMSPWLALVCMGLYLVYLAMYTRLNRQLRTSSKRLTETYSTMQERANETLLNIDTIQMYRSQNFFSSRFGGAVDAHTDNQQKLQLWKSLGQTATGTALELIPIIALVLGVILFQQNAITLGQIVAFYAFLPHLGEPFRNLADFNMSYQSVKGLEERLESIIFIPKQGKPKLKLDGINSLELCNLHFSYSGDKPIFSGLNFSLRKGDIVGVVGASGAGKSTLIKLLANRLWAKGVLVNDRAMNEWCEDSYLSQIAVLPQDTFLFDGEISDNIKLGRTNDGSHYPEKIAEAENIVDQAISLSGGERQRIGLARALYCNIDLLILDEPTSALDEVTEEKVVTNLKDFFASRDIIVVIVSHRPRILEICNKKLIVG